jgi:hypothetical protein
MASVFREFLSSFGAVLDSGFDSDLSAMGVGFDSGLDSVLPGLDVTIVVLLFWFLPLGAGHGKAWKIVDQALKKAHWKPLNSPKVGTLHAAYRPCIPDWRLQKVLTFAYEDAVQFCSRMTEQPLTWRVVQRTVREAQVHRGEYAELRMRGQDFPLRIGLKSHLYCDAD